MSYVSMNLEVKVGTSWPVPKSRHVAAAHHLVLRHILHITWAIDVFNFLPF